jgi:hypothetical protein
MPLPGVHLPQAWRPAAALAVMAAAVGASALALDALAAGLPGRAAALIVALPAVAVGVIALAAGLIAFGAIGPDWWRQLPGCAAGSGMDGALTRLYTALRRRAPLSIHHGKDDPL